MDNLGQTRGVKPLIDGDILLHEIGWSGEFKDKETGEEILLDPEHVLDLLDKKIENICYEVGATEPPLIFLSDNEYIARREKRPYVKGFRYEVAKTRPYKGNRINPKPYHFYNILAYIMGAYDYVVSSGGLEADDEICFEQYQNEDKYDTIICSRDKDVRICPGWHYSWECGKQRAIGPTYTDSLGWLEKKEGGEILGYGLSFFYYQMLVGDTADYIPGLPGFGKAKAWELLHEVKDAIKMKEIVVESYKEVMGEKANEYYKEQANLLWMRFKKRP